MPEEKRIELTAVYASPRGAHRPGAILVLPASEADQLVDCGYANYVTDTPPVTAADAIAEAHALPVTEIGGIGPKTAEKVAALGVETVGDFLAANPAELAEESGIRIVQLGAWRGVSEDG